MAGGIGHTRRTGRAGHRQPQPQGRLRERGPASRHHAAEGRTVGDGRDRPSRRRKRDRIRDTLRVRGVAGGRLRTGRRGVPPQRRNGLPRHPLRGGGRQPCRQPRHHRLRPGTERSGGTPVRMDFQRTDPELQRDCRPPGLHRQRGRGRDGRTALRVAPPVVRGHLRPFRPRPPRLRHPHRPMGRSRGLHAEPPERQRRGVPRKGLPAGARRHEPGHLFI